MPAGKLVFRPDVENGRGPAAQPIEQLIAGYRFELVASAEIARHHTRDFGAVALADAAKGSQQTYHHLVAGETIVDVLAVATAFDKRSTAKKLQMTGGIGEGEARTGRQILHAALPLPEMFEQFEPMRMGKRVSDLRETRKNLLFRPGVA
jgi:hypothetical protein